jgi:hypothetical protein
MPRPIRRGQCGQAWFGFTRSLVGHNSASIDSTDIRRAESRFLNRFCRELLPKRTFGGRLAVFIIRLEHSYSVMTLKANISPFEQGHSPGP